MGVTLRDAFNRYGRINARSVRNYGFGWLWFLQRPRIGAMRGRNRKLRRDQLAGPIQTIRQLADCARACGCRSADTCNGGVVRRVARMSAATTELHEQDAAVRIETPDFNHLAHVYRWM